MGSPCRVHFSTRAKGYHDFPATRLLRGRNGARFELNFVFNEGLCLNKHRTSSFLAYGEVGKRVLKFQANFSEVFAKISTSNSTSSFPTFSLT